MNLGHGVLPTTPEDNVRFFFETSKNVNDLLAVAK
jgi:uroporphyrinogen decarboxylase